jgi:protein-S-isoprenylcysteine O-methyltransferase Ste14
MKAELKVKKHGERTDLAGEHPWGDMGQLILFLIFLVVWVGDSFFFKYSTFLSSDIPIYIRLPIAFVILAGAVHFIRAAHRIIFDAESQQPSVIRTGIFNQVRHPLYLGSLLFYPGLFVLTLSILSFIVWLGIIAFYHFIARFEEKLLLDKFGAEYEKYRSDVPMWIPRLRKS